MFVTAIPLANGLNRSRYQGHWAGEHEYTLTVAITSSVANSLDSTIRAAEFGSVSQLPLTRGSLTGISGITTHRVENTGVSQWLSEMIPSTKAPGSTAHVAESGLAFQRLLERV